MYLRASTLLFFCLAGCSLSVWAQNPMVRLQTNMGDIVLELEKDKAPETVNNFLRYVKEGFYSGTVFHRVIDGFMAQGGGFTENLQHKPTNAPIQNEAFNGLKNLRGTVAMARTNAPHSASSQFFINLVDNAFLDFRSKTPDGWGYAVFGKVVDGQAVVDKMGKLPTHNEGQNQNVPNTAVIIQSASIVTSAPAAK